MSNRGVRCFAAASVGAAAIALIAFVFLAVGDREHPQAATPPHAVQSPCEQALLRDWSDGRIDHDYPLACYRSALTSLPSDLEVYSSAHDDIAQALSRRLQSAGKQRAIRSLTR